MDTRAVKEKTRQKKVNEKPNKKKDKKKNESFEETGYGTARVAHAATEETEYEHDELEGTYTRHARTVYTVRPKSVSDLKSFGDTVSYFEKKRGGNEAPDELYSTIDEVNLAPDIVYIQNKELAKQHRREGESVNQSTNDVCDDYRTMVKIFQSLIVKKVIIGQLLPHLTFIDDKAKWYGLGNTDQRKAMQELMEEMLRCNKIGQWKAFIEGLERCGYSYIVENIKGYKVIDNEYQEQYLKILAPLLRGMIKPSYILPHLSAKFTINDDDKEAIIATEKMVGELAASDLLLDRVPRKHEFWYRHLLESFKESGRDDIAEYLDIPEMMTESKQSKDPIDKRSQNPYSHMITGVSSQERRLKTKSTMGSHSTSNTNVKRNSLSVDFTQQVSELHMNWTTQTISEEPDIGTYIRAKRHARPIRENSSVQYVALDLDIQEYDDADVCMDFHKLPEKTKGDISSAVSQQNSFVSNINQEQEYYITPATLTQTQSEPSSDDELDELDSLYEQVQTESKTLIKKEQKLEKIEAKRKENLEKQRSLDERKNTLKTLLRREKSSPSMSQDSASGSTYQTLATTPDDYLASDFYERQSQPSTSRHYNATATEEKYMASDTYYRQPQPFNNRRYYATSSEEKYMASDTYERQQHASNSRRYQDVSTDVIHLQHAQLGHVYESVDGEYDAADIKEDNPFISSCTIEEMTLEDVLLKFGLQSEDFHIKCESVVNYLKAI